MSLRGPTAQAGDPILDGTLERPVEAAVALTTAREAGGTGLGLPIARAIVAGARGRLEIVPAERGAHFAVWLPGWAWA